MAKSTTLLEKIWSYGDEAVDRLIGWSGSRARG